MFLSKLFKHTRARVLTALAGLTMVFGAAAAVSTARATQQNEVVETKATYRTGTAGRNIYLNLAGFTSWENKDGSGVAPEFMLHGYGWDNFQTGGGETWDDFYSFTALGDSNTHLYRAGFSADSYSMKIHRRNSSTHVDWNTAEYGNLNTSQIGTKNVFKINGWNSGDWDNSTYNIYKITMAAESHGSGCKIQKSGGSDSITAGNYGFGYAHHTFVLTAGTPEYGWKFGSWTISGGTVTKVSGSTTSSSYSFNTLTDDIEISCNYVRDTKNITITYNGNGATGGSAPASQTQSNSASFTSRANTFTRTNYTFDSWNSKDDGSGTRIAASTSVPAYTFIDNTTLYAQWKVSQGVYLVGLSDWTIENGLIPVAVGDGLVKWTDVEISVDDAFKIYAADSSGNLSYYGDDYTSDSADGWGHFTAPHDGSDNNIVCKTAGTFDVFFNTSTHIIYLYMAGVPSTNGFYMAGTGTFAGTNGSYTFAGTERMDSDPSGNNVAIKESASGLSVSNGSKLQFAQISDYKTIWYDIVKGGTWPKGWDVSSNQAEYTGLGGKFNFYVKTATGDISTGAHQGQGSATLYIVDVDAIDQYGFLYFATTASSGSVTLTTYENSTAVLSGVALSTITGWEESSAVNSFNGITGTVHLYKMPIYNLRGSDVGKLVNKVVFRVSGSNYTVTGLPTAAGATPHYYSNVGAGGTAAATTGMGAAAKAVFDLDEALAGGISICTLDDKWATLKSVIEAGRTGSSTLMDGAKITTYADKDKSSTTGVLVSDIYKEICKQLGVASGIAAWPLAAWVIPGAPKGNESPLTMTLWIVSGCGVAGLGAIGAAYFISKKKKRHQA